MEIIIRKLLLHIYNNFLKKKKKKGRMDKKIRKKKKAKNTKSGHPKKYIRELQSTAHQQSSFVLISVPTALLDFVYSAADHPYLRLLSIHTSPPVGVNFFGYYHKQKSNCSWP